MPHITVKLWPGKTEEQKRVLAERIAHDVMDVLHCGPDSVSVAMEEVPASAWEKMVFRPDIEKQAKNLYKKPGYTM